MKIATIVGARPQFIKYAGLSKEILKNHNEILIHTGQHYDYELSKIFFDQLHIPTPDYNLNIHENSHGKQTGKIIIEIEKVLLKEKPDLTIVFGDTNSTLAGSLASVKLHIPIAHVEAGLRSFNKTMPEEINRILTDHMSEILFAPTNHAISNLKNEGITKNVFHVGDIMYDYLIKITKIIDKSKILQEKNLKSKEYILFTMHRQSNTDNLSNITNIISALSSVDETIIFSAHPRTLKIINKHNIQIGKNIIILKPIGYFDFLHLEKNAKKIITDSGGIQKEAYIFKVPCITLREDTEWVETVDDDWNILVGASKEKIINAINNFSPNNKQFNHFGDGNANKKIIKIINKMEI